MQLNATIAKPSIRTIPEIVRDLRLKMLDDKTFFSLGLETINMLNLINTEVGSISDQGSHSEDKMQPIILGHFVLEERIASLEKQLEAAKDVIKMVKGDIAIYENNKGVV